MLFYLINVLDGLVVLELGCLQLSLGSLHLIGPFENMDQFGSVASKVTLCVSDLLAKLPQWWLITLYKCLLTRELLLSGAVLVIRVGGCPRFFKLLFL